MRSLLKARSGPETEALRSQRFNAEALPHMDDLFRGALRLTRDRDRAKDAVQETYLQAWRSFDRFESGTNCKAWLYRILFHCVHHQRRKWFRFPVLGESEERLEAVVAAPVPIPETLTDEQVMAALDRLSADYRAVIQLVDIEEFEYKEAAQILEVPIGTIMSRLSRARKALRSDLADAAKDYGIGKGGRE